MKKTISVALAVTALCVLSIATLWKIVQYTQAATAEKIRLELVRKAFMQQLPTQSGGYDFQPTLEAEDGIYFWVPDERSVYRLQSEILTPEYVCGDCDGYVQIVDETLQFLRDTGKTGQWICADLDGSNQQILKTGISTRNVNYIVLGQFLLDNRGSMHDNAHRTSVQVARLSADRAEQTDLAKFCLGEQPAFRLLWTNGDVLYFSSYSYDADKDIFIRPIWRYNFVDAPEQVEFPSSYSYRSCHGDELFFQDDSANTHIFSLPDEEWTATINASGLCAAGDGNYYYQKSGIIYLVNEEGESVCWAGSKECDIAVAGDYLVCHYQEFHEDFETCGCGASYAHYYIRTQIIDRNKNTRIWTSHGNTYTLDF